MPRTIVIDDDPGIRRAVAAHLRGAGHVVELAASGREALDLLKAAPADLVITDINMPDMDGIEVIMALRDQSPDVPIIAISGGGLFPPDLLLANAELLGVVESLVKPFEASELLGAVSRALGVAR